jgi:hypothetical protein
MRTIRKALYCAACIIGLLPVSAQVQQNLAIDYWWTSTNTFSVGDSPNGGVNGAFLNVRGDQVQPGSTKANVFRTIGSPGFNAFWRFFSDGPTAIDERAQFFSLTGENHFNLNTPNGDFRLLTSTIERARLYGTQTSNFNASYPAVAQGGFYALSGQPNFFTQGGSPGPFSRLHLVDQAGNGGTPIFYAPTAAYRGWMRNGVTFSGNADMGYIGQRYNGNDRTDMVIHWSNDAGTMAFAPDRLRFLFTTAQDAAPSGSSSVAGLEAARFYPARTDEVFMGLGDFFAGNLVDPTNITEPTERFDVLNGRVRFRDLPDPPGEADGPYQVMVVDNSTFPNAERGVVKWVDPNDLPQASADCDWIVQPTQPHVSSVYDGSNCDWDQRHGVGVGVQTPKAKLHVWHTNNELLDRKAILASSRFDVDQGQEVFGIDAEARPAATFERPILGMHAIGVRGSGLASKYSSGVIGAASVLNSTGVAQDVIGVAGFGTAGNNAVRCIGVYGTASGAQSFNSWAGWFDGQIIASAYQPSDEILKTNVEIIENPLETLSQLQPKRYNYRTDEYERMNLPAGQQFGFLAGEVSEILPGLVASASRPEEVDSLGNVIAERVDFQALNYDGVIPILVAGIQEQQAMITDQRSEMAQLNSRLDEMASQLAACCSNPDGGRALPQQDTEVGILHDTEGDRKLHIQPNPFSESTTVFYMLERSGRAQLMANSADGKELRVLQEANLESGSYLYEWNTADLAAGIYYVTLLLDGQPVVKKAVKVNR